MKSSDMTYLKRAGLGFLVAAGVIFGGNEILKRTIDYYPEQTLISTRDIVETHSLFEGSVNLKKIETNGTFGRGYHTWEDIILSTKYELTINEPGEYLLEGWAVRYRASDQRTERWKFSVDITPETKEVELSSLVRRLEATRTVDGSIQRDSIMLDYHGETGASLIGVGDQLP